jgi:hypothetical protein
VVEEEKNDGGRGLNTIIVNSKKRKFGELEGDVFEDVALKKRKINT